MARCASGRADPDTLHRVYSALLDALPLDAHHVDRLRARGLRGDLRAAGYRTLGRNRWKGVRVLIDAGLEGYLPGVPGFYVQDGPHGAYWTVAGASGLLFPVRDVAARIAALQVHADFIKGNVPRYSFVSSTKRGGPGSGAPVHVPLFAGDRSLVRVTEGALKADVATHMSGVLTLGLSGVAWRDAPHVLRGLGAKTARVAFDADARRKPAVADSQLRLLRDLSGRGFAVALEVWDETAAKGIDDALMAGAVLKVLAGADALVAAEEIRQVARASAAPPAAHRPLISVTLAKKPGHYVIRCRVEVG